MGTITAPYDEDEVILRERCFDAGSEVSLTKWAAPLAAKTSKALRFAVSDKVAIRVRDTDAGYESWAVGDVVSIWPALPGEPDDRVPYKVKTDAGEVYHC